MRFFHSFLVDEHLIINYKLTLDCVFCGLAVTGLPDPNPKHAEDMCKFAKEIFVKMQQLTIKLEELLGPDTSSLSMRFGLHR